MIVGYIGIQVLNGSNEARSRYFSTLNNHWWQTLDLKRDRKWLTSL